MHIDPTRAKTLTTNLSSILSRISSATPLPLLRATHPPRRGLQTQTRQRHPRPAQPTHLTPPLRRKLSTRTAPKIPPPTARHPLALHRRAADQQMQTAGRADPEPVVRGERGYRKEGGSTREGEGGHVRAGEHRIPCANAVEGVCAGEYVGRGGESGG